MIRPALLVVVSCLMMLNLMASCSSQAHADLLGADTRGFDLPLPPATLVPTTAARHSSANGTHTVTVGPLNYYAHGGTITDVDGDASFGSVSGTSEPTYAIYAMPVGWLGVEAIEPEIVLGTHTGGGNSTCFMGIANYGTNRWEWTELTSPAIPPVSCDESYHNRRGYLFVAIVAHGGSAFTLSAVNAALSGISVGPGMDYPTIKQAYDSCTGGETVIVTPKPGNASYDQEALQVYLPGITFAGLQAPDGSRVPINGAGFNYNGVGSTPRAIFQFNPDAHGGRVMGFDLFNASNDTENGAGVRINQSNDITVKNCEVRNNDMGMMSNGNGTQDVSRNQRIMYCHFHHNGNYDDIGHNHNFYLGGTSVVISGCEINNALTGHNVKSRAHYTRVEWCYLHDSENREFDLVDATGDTTAPQSHAVLIGNVIVKAQGMAGNKHTIHFGQDGGHDHNGKLYMVNNTIISPYITPVVQITAPSAGAVFSNNIIWDGGVSQFNQTLVSVANGAQLTNVSGSNNWLSAGQQIPAGTVIEMATTRIAADMSEVPPFVDGTNADWLQRDYHLAAQTTYFTNTGKPLSGLVIPAEAGAPQVAGLYEYEHPLWYTPRPVNGELDLGAYELPVQ